ncbi:MAG: hypothetical protein HQM08_10475 [Candidatus Riflebacteria bacterium]|nr:hypothetical protein [Candidatus Riflebacteria bacterium]
MRSNCFGRAFCLHLLDLALCLGTLVSNRVRIGDNQNVSNSLWLPVGPRSCLADTSWSMLEQSIYSQLQENAGRVPFLDLRLERIKSPNRT